MTSLSRIIASVSRAFPNVSLWRMPLLECSVGLSFEVATSDSLSGDEMLDALFESMTLPCDDDDKDYAALASYSHVVIVFEVNAMGDDDCWRFKFKCIDSIVKSMIVIALGVPSLS